MIGSAVLGAYSKKKERDAQKEQYNEQMRLRASEQRYSPWLGKAQTPIGQMPTAQPLFGGMQGALSGVSAWQNYQNMESKQKLIDAMTKDLQTKKEIGGDTGGATQVNNSIKNQIINDAILGRTTYKPNAWGGQPSMNQLGGPQYK